MQAESRGVGAAVAPGKDGSQETGVSERVLNKII